MNPYRLALLTSKGFCVVRLLRVLFRVLFIGIILFVVGAVMRARKQEKRERVNVTVSSVKSSHKLVKHSVKKLKFPREEVVPAVRVAGSTNENCTRVLESDGMDATDIESCKCSGYSYEFEGQTVQCPGHQGRCNFERNHIVKRASESGDSSLTCKSDDTVTCSFEFAPFFDKDSEDTAESFPLTCNMSKHCQSSGVMNLPVSTTAHAVVSCPTDKWNTCTMSFFCMKVKSDSLMCP